ncbi:MAG: hypothetical protein JRI39_07795 [Deltaproteobacteria bacterium]|nr:hypothetical protein [Deltaproteobacteria bacterium]
MCDHNDLHIYLRPTPIIDADHPDIKAHVAAVVRDEPDQIQMAVRLYYAVRDGIWYDPYYPFYKPEHYRASNVLNPWPSLWYPFQGWIRHGAQSLGYQGAD